MRRRLNITLLAWLAVLPLAHADTYVPSSDDTVLLRVPTSSDPLYAELNTLRQDLAADPTSEQAAVAFARHAITIGRRTAEPRYAGYAQAALEPWWNAEAPPTEIRVLRATLLQHNHHFDAAVADLSAIIENHPGHAQALLTRAVIRTVQGDPEAAVEDCRRLLGRTDNLTTATCTANSASLLGRAESADAVLTRALAQAESAGADQHDLLWAYTVSAELAERLGRDDTEARFQRMLDATDAERRDPYGLSAYADFLLAQGRPEEARALLLPHDELDGAMLRLAIAERRLIDAGQSELQERHEQRVQTIGTRFAEARQRGTSVHHREEAMFELHVRGRPAEALWLAQRNWREQREPLDALLLLDAARAADRPAAMEPVRSWVAELGLEDVRIEQRLEAGQ